MEPEQIKWSDWHRIFMGEAPAAFLLELIFRTVVVFFLLVISLRLLGKPMSSRLTRIETTALFVLAAAVGVPLPSPDRGLIPAVVIAFVVILVGRFVSKWAFKNPGFERTVVDHYTTLVKDGVLQMEKMKKTRITVERLMSYLRENKIIQLGEVERLYFEANGTFSIVKSKNPKPGLFVLPPEDTDFLQELEHVGQMVCKRCGAEETVRSGNGSRCANCGSTEQTEAVK